MPKITVISIPLSSVVERVTSNDEVSRSSRLVGNNTWVAMTFYFFTLISRISCDSTLQLQSPRLTVLSRLENTHKTARLIGPKAGNCDI